eukprot:5107523-Amphidinium_carterae.2
MSPKGRKIENFMICSRPPTPRHGDQADEEWTTVCCLCQDVMQPEDTWACCRCTHKCHLGCRHHCGEDIVCVHCKRDHFLPGQEFDPPLSNADLMSNISHGVTVAGSSKLKRIEQEQLSVLEGLGRAEPVLNHFQIEDGVGSGVTSLAGAVLCSVNRQNDPNIKESVHVRSASSGKRTATELDAPPGLELEESEAKARKTMMIHSVNLQQQNGYKAYGTALGRSQVARFAVQGFDHQWIQHQGLQQMDVWPGMKMQLPNMKPMFLFFARKQKRHSLLIGLLDGTVVPVKEVFSQIYAERNRINDLITRLELLEDNGAIASANEVCLAMDARINSIVHAIWSDRDLVEKTSAQQRQIAELDGQQYAMTHNFEKLGSKLLDRQEEKAGEKRREFLKFRSEIQAKVGVDEQKIRKLTEDYLKTATGDGTKQVRIELHSKAIRDLEENQKTLRAALMKLKESDDGRVLATSKEQERTAQLEVVVQELMAKQVKEQKSSKPSYAEPQSASGPARGRSRGGSQKGQRPKVASQSAQSADSDYVHIN